MSVAVAVAIDSTAGLLADFKRSDTVLLEERRVTECEIFPLEAFTLAEVWFATVAWFLVGSSTRRSGVFLFRFPRFSLGLLLSGTVLVDCPAAVESSSLSQMAISNWSGIDRLSSCRSNSHSCEISWEPFEANRVECIDALLCDPCWLAPNVLLVFIPLVIQPDAQLYSVDFIYSRHVAVTMLLPILSQQLQL